MTGKVFLGELKGRWESDFRNSLRLSYRQDGGKIPNWLTQTSPEINDDFQLANSPQQSLNKQPPVNVVV